MRSPVIAVLSAAALAVGLVAHAQEPPASAGALPPCDKNHYILDTPCAFRATEFAIGYVGAVAIDPAGQVHFSSPNVVYRIDSRGLLIRVAGTGSAGFSGDGGPAPDAKLNLPQWYPERRADPMDWSELLGPLAFDPEGNLYIGDAYNGRVRRVDGRGFIDTVHFGWLPQGVAADARGNLYVSDGSGVLLRLAPDGSVTPLTANDCGSHRMPGLCAPEGIAVDPSGNVYVADGYCRIRRVSPEGVITTVAGRESPDGRGWAFTCGYMGDGPAPTSALAWPFAVALDAAGNLLIADTYNHCIRKVDAEQMLTTIVGICRAAGFAGDGGQARGALLDAPHGVAVDAAGNIYIADTNNHRVRMVDVAGVISTIAGNGVRQCRTESWGLMACDAP